MAEEDRNTRTEAPLMRIEEMTEEDVKHLFITPAIHAAGWDPHAQMRLEYFFTDGRVIVNGRSYNLDLCGYPHEEEEIKPPLGLIADFQKKRSELNAKMDVVLAEIQAALGNPF